MMDSTFPKIFVIILNYNGKNTLPACLSSVFQSDYPNFEVVVVDNNSQDDSFEQAKRNFSRSHFIKNSENIGFSKGNNIGIRFSLEKFADYIFVLNNDAIVEKTTLSFLMNIAQTNPSAGIVSPLILNGNKDIWFAGGKIQWGKMRAIHLTQKTSDQPYSSEYLSGCAMLIKKEVFKKIGLFEERFFLYYEDADFSLRAKKAGFKLLVAPTITIQHLEQSSGNDSKNYWLVLSGLLFFKIHSTGFWKLWIFFYLRLRKMKNFYNYYFSKNIATENVRRAYKDFKKISA